MTKVILVFSIVICGFLSAEAKAFSIAGSPANNLVKDLQNVGVILVKTQNKTTGRVVSQKMDVKDLHCVLGQMHRAGNRSSYENCSFKDTQRTRASEINGSKAKTLVDGLERAGVRRVRHVEISTITVPRISCSKLAQSFDCESNDAAQ